MSEQTGLSFLIQITISMFQFDLIKLITIILPSEN